jgi:uncharacterized protein YkwD
MTEPVDNARRDAAPAKRATFRVLAIVLAAIALPFTTAATCEPGASVFDGGSLEESNLVSLINQQRTAANCPSVTRDQALANAASRHSVDMRDHGIRDHPGSDGSTPQTRIADAGYSPTSATGEILYWSDGASDYKAAVAWWMASPTHKAIIEDCRYTNIGVGILYPGGTKYYAVADFGAH